MNEDDLDPFYTSLCSSTTLQSNKQGFFLDYANHVAQTTGKNWLHKVFGKLKTDKERLLICYADPKVQPVVHNTLQHVTELYRPKSSSVSHQRRLEGLHSLNEGELQRALMLFNQSVIRAPKIGKDKTVDNGMSLPLALAARSEVLLELREYEFCITDIQMAIKEGFSEHLRYQLYWRMGRCYREQGQPAKAKVSLQIALKLLSQHQDNIGKNSTAHARTLNEELTNLDATKVTASSTKKQNENVLPKLTGEHNPTLPAASNLVGVSKSDVAGRFAVASGSIVTGDTLVVEKPYAACLLPEMFGSHCHHCFNKLHVPMACPDCSGLAFCSAVCRDEACTSYHKYECHFMDLLIGSGMSILCHVAMRMVTQSGLEYFVQHNSALPINKQDSKSDYEAVCNLVTHSDRRPPDDFLHRTLMAIFLLKCLQKTTFFPQPTQDQMTLSKDELSIASSLLLHLQLLQFNAHEVYETRMEAPGKFRSARAVYIGVGLYPTVALFNHDCYPAISRYFIGRNIVISAIRPLTKGQILAENYGPNFVKRTLAARQRTLLSRYWFRCDCQACNEDWPLFEKQNNLSFRFKCSTEDCKGQLRCNSQKKVKCPSCKKQIPLEDSLSLLNTFEKDYDKGIEAMENGNASVAIPLFCSYINKIHSMGYPPYKNLHLSQEALRTCLADNGNKWILHSEK